MDFGEVITYNLDNHVAVLTINGEGPLNIIQRPFYKGYNDALTHYREDDEARVLLIQSGNPKHFTAGFDVSTIHRGLKEGFGNTITDNDMVTPKPIVVAVKGYCIGEGFGIMLAGDYVFADQSSMFKCPEVRLGFNAVTMQVKLAQRIGQTRAMEFMILGDAHDVYWLDRVGMCTQVCHGDAEERALAYAHRIAEECGPIAVRGTKGAVWHTINSNKDEAIDFALWAKDLCLDSKDIEEGVASFIDKRPPNFKNE
jgi:enoyl-CoA hydratase/carnithine racemase|tara:strand:+ start:160 stop:924 length:765 start_codon:yes stop_codon:yes gene_type:complete